MRSEETPLSSRDKTYGGFVIELQDYIRHTLRVPRVGREVNADAGYALARQLDSTLLSVGFKCDTELFDYLAGLYRDDALSLGLAILEVARDLAGDHVRHNSYFVDFPDNVPDTQEFWASCLIDALLDPASSENVAGQVAAGEVNLLDLPRYGSYQHSYEELISRHDDLIASGSDRLTVFTLGGSIAEESHRLYTALASMAVPMNEEELELLGELAEIHVHDRQPDAIPVRENRAVINNARLASEAPLLVDTVVDVLRLACAASGGDVSLSTPTRLRSFRRPERRMLMEALEEVAASNPRKISDVKRYKEQFKRLGERLHPHDFSKLSRARGVFAVARGEVAVQTQAGRVEEEIAAGAPDDAVQTLSTSPGTLLRSIDRLLRAGADVEHLAAAVSRACASASTRVILALREHLGNRHSPAGARVFVNQSGRAWVEEDSRPPLPEDAIATLVEVLDSALADRLAPDNGQLVIAPESQGLSLPISEKSKPGGLGVLPRGSVFPVSQGLRFFVHWHEAARTTDYDLSVLMLDDAFEEIGQVSYTNLRTDGDRVVHSGDITTAFDGATEFIDINLETVGATYIIPQIHIFAGEGFDVAAEAFFGYMERDRIRKGMPFEAKTVRMKSDLFGSGRVALPAVFFRDAEGHWQVKWMHLVMNGLAFANTVESHGAHATLMARAIFEREYLNMEYLASLMERKGNTPLSDMPATSESLTYIGIENPEDPPQGSAIFTPANLGGLLT